MIIFVIAIPFIATTISAYASVTINGDTAVLTIPLKETNSLNNISDINNIEGFVFYTKDFYGNLPPELSVSLSCSLSVKISSEQQPRAFTVSTIERGRYFLNFNTTDSIIAQGMCSLLVKNTSNKPVNVGQVIPFLAGVVHDGGNESMLWISPTDESIGTLSPQINCHVNASPSVVTFLGSPEVYVGGMSENISIVSGCSDGSVNPVLRFGSNGSNGSNGCISIKNESGQGELNFCATHDDKPIALDYSTGISSGVSTEGDTLMDIQVTMKADSASAVAPGVYPAVLFIVVSPL